MRYLSIDLGLKRIGLALSVDGMIATPLEAIIRKNRNQAAGELKNIISEWKIDALVVGIPLGGSSEDEMRRRIEHFLSLVEFGGEVFFQDESDSSLEAQELMRGDIKYKRDGRVDSISALIIMKRYLNII